MSLAHDDCFTRLDEAFARLEHDLEHAGDPAPPPASTAPAAPADLDEALSAIDRHIAGRAAGAAGPGAPPSPLMRPVSPVMVGVPAPAAATTLVTDDALWSPEAFATPLERLVATVHNLQWMLRAIQSGAGRGSERISADELSRVFADARQSCVDFDLRTARVRADFALAALEQNHIDHLGREVAELVRHIRHDLRSCSIWPIPQKSVWGFGVGLGTAAAAAFPSSTSEVAESGRCIGFGLYDAAVFHLLRAARPGLRALLRTHRRATPDATGIAEWGAGLETLERRLGEVARWAGGATRERALEFYEPLMGVLRVLHDAAQRQREGCRLAHEHDATAAWHATRDFLSHLAPYVSETRTHTLTRRDFAKGADPGWTPRPR